MNDIEIENQINYLQKQYTDLRLAFSSLSNNLDNTAFISGALVSAGKAAELILKCVYRKEKVMDSKIPLDKADEIKKQESDKLMLDDLIRLVGDKVPLRLIPHLRNIQAWRNIGSHDKGDINETVNASTLQVVSVAMNELVIWFVGEYLNHDTSGFDATLSSSDVKTNIEDYQQWIEAYWYAMKDLTISKLEQSQLDFLAKKIKLTEEVKMEFISQFNRDKEGFVELVSEIFAHNIFTADDLEHLEYIRKESCIAVKEAKEIISELSNFSSFSQFLLTENLDFAWFEKASTTASNSIDNTQVASLALENTSNKSADTQVDFVSEEAETLETEDEEYQEEIVYDDEIVTVTQTFYINQVKHEYLFDYKYDYLKMNFMQIEVNHKTLVFVNDINENYKFSRSVNRNENNFNRPLFWAWEKLDIRTLDEIDLSMGTGFNSVKVDIPYNNIFPSHTLFKRFDLGQSVEIIIDRFPNDTQYYQLNVVFGPAAQRINNRQIIFSYKLKFGVCLL
jgi:hypothetical protein